MIAMSCMHHRSCAKALAHEATTRFFVGTSKGKLGITLPLRCTIAQYHSLHWVKDLSIFVGFKRRREIDLTKLQQIFYDLSFCRNEKKFIRIGNGMQMESSCGRRTKSRCGLLPCRQRLSGRLRSDGKICRERLAPVERPRLLDSGAHGAPYKSIALRMCPHITTWTEAPRVPSVRGLLL